ncbi:response regulator transcription factor [Natronosalvus halobius]|uniref:response regulator transcription factor n=1 Tax=Natronosalvus halobius TaxID=2953746 RepID=UPI0020A1DF11|nr:HalX domain-containing protein [Natronosalvus halobius]USZ70646.1 HalX domain-containing protein [Natronosalvus halobius]
MATSTNTADDSNGGTVLIVDDEPAITSAYARWLEGTYEVRAANSGPGALENLDEGVDVVLLDRRMPDVSGDELLETIRERGLDCRVAIVSAVEPDFDIIDMGFDMYLEKPVSEPSELRETVSKLLDRSTYDEQMQQFLSLASKKASLEAKKNEDDLSSNEEYQELADQVDSLRADLSATAMELDDEDLRAEFHNH